MRAHPLNLPVLYPEWMLVYDTDNADFLRGHLREPVTEAALTAGSRYIADLARTQGAGEAHVLWTGTPFSTAPRPPYAGLPTVAVWAQIRPRLTRGGGPRRSGDGTARPEVTFRLFDWRPSDDLAFAESFRHLGLKTCRYRDYLKNLDDVAIGLSPLSSEIPFSSGK